MTDNVLLLTGTIKPNNGLKQKSQVLSNKYYFKPEYREKEYLSTILYYITNSNFDKFIFCENSGYKINGWEFIEKFARKFGKKVELLQFVGDSEKIKKYSYSYGEAEILDYAFEHSNFIKESDKFFKVTGRYIIYNINNLINAYKENEYFFYKGFGIVTLWVNTAFFMVSKKTYEKYLHNKIISFYETQKSNTPLEVLYYDFLKDKLFNDNQKISYFPIFHFFKIKNLGLEILKQRFGLLGYGITGKLIDKILPKLKKLY